MSRIHIPWSQIQQTRTSEGCNNAAEREGTKSMVLAQKHPILNEDTQAPDMVKTL